MCLWHGSVGNPGRLQATPVASFAVSLLVMRKMLLNGTLLLCWEVRLLFSFSVWRVCSTFVSWLSLQICFYFMFFYCWQFLKTVYSIPSDIICRNNLQLRTAFLIMLHAHNFIWASQKLRDLHGGHTGDPKLRMLPPSFPHLQLPVFPYYLLSLFSCGDYSYHLQNCL